MKKQHDTQINVDVLNIITVIQRPCTIAEWVFEYRLFVVSCLYEISCFGGRGRVVVCKLSSHRKLCYLPDYGHICELCSPMVVCLYIKYMANDVSKTEFCCCDSERSGRCSEESDGPSFATVHVPMYSHST